MSEADSSPDAVVRPAQTPPALPPPAPVAAGQARQHSPLAEFAIDVAIAVGLIFGISLVASLVWGTARGLELAASGIDAARIMEHIGEPGLLFQMGMTALSIGTAALVLVWWRRRPTAGERAYSRAASRRRSTWILAVGTGIATTLLATAVSVLADTAGVDLAPSNEPLIRALLTQSPWLMIPFAVGLAPVYEEVLFRRVFYGRLLAAGRPMLALMLSAGLFAFVHEVPGLGGNPWPVTLLLWLVYAALGAAFALLYRHCGTLWAPIAAHATHNLLACLLLLNDVS